MIGSVVGGPSERREAMGDVIDLKGQPAHLEDDELIENLARFADGTLSEAAVKSRHHLSNEDWAALGESDKLVELVEACKTTPNTHRRHQAGARANRDRRRPANSRQNHAGPQRQRTAQDRFDQNTRCACQHRSRSRGSRGSI